VEHERDVLELLKSEPKSGEDGGQVHSPRALRRPRHILEDPPSCPDLGDPARPHPCKGCPLMKFVSDERQKNSPCWLIALNEKGDTIDYLDCCGTPLELEEALAGWLRSQIARIDQLATSTRPLLEEYGELSKLGQS
jgi:hypothetical protein